MPRGVLIGSAVIWWKENAVNDNRWISNISQLFIFLVMIIMITSGLYLTDFVHPETAAAHSSDVFGPACEAGD